MILFSSSISSTWEFESSINIETNISDKGLPIFEIYGLVSRSVDESKKRILSSFESIGVNFPLKNITVNLSPAEFPKEGTHYDLGIATSILRYTSFLNFNIKEDLFLGELSFDGSLVELKNITFLVLSAVNVGYKRIYVPFSNLKDLTFIRDVEIFGVRNLKELLDISSLSPLKLVDKDSRVGLPTNFLKIIGNSSNKRLLSIAISGKHHLLIKGFPGSGKSLLAKAAQDLAPDLNLEEAYEVAKTYSYLNIERSLDNFYKTPFRSPHSSSSYASIFGSGGRNIIPGEISLANNGILFLDELPEFNRQVLEGLRAPLEDKKISISRAGFKKIFDSDFILIAAMNPCKCGYFNHPKFDCKCTPFEIKKYQSRISGPIIDRLDIDLNFDGKIENQYSIEQDSYSIEEFENLRRKILKVRSALLQKNIDGLSNSPGLFMSKSFIQSFLSDKALNIVKNIQEKYSVSNRKYFKVLKLALTISMFNENELIYPDEILEAVQLSNIVNY